MTDTAALEVGPVRLTGLGLDNVSSLRGSIGVPLKRRRHDLRSMRLETPPALEAAFQLTRAGDGELRLADLAIGSDLGPVLLYGLRPPDGAMRAGTLAEAPCITAVDLVRAKGCRAEIIGAKVPMPAPAHDSSRWNRRRQVLHERPIAPMSIPEMIAWFGREVLPAVVAAPTDLARQARAGLAYLFGAQGSGPIAFESEAPTFGRFEVDVELGDVTLRMEEARVAIWRGDRPRLERTANNVHASVSGLFSPDASGGLRIVDLKMRCDSLGIELRHGDVHYVPGHGFIERAQWEVLVHDVPAWQLPLDAAREAAKAGLKRVLLGCWTNVSIADWDEGLCSPENVRWSGGVWVSQDEPQGGGERSASEDIWQWRWSVLGPSPGLTCSDVDGEGQAKG